MAQAIGATLTKAFAIAISVIPLVGLIVFVTAKGGRAKGAAYTSGWFLSLWLATFALSWIGTAALSGSDGKPSTGVALLQGGLGVIFFAISVWFIANRPKDPSQVKQPGWMTAVDSTSAVVAFGIGAFGVVVNGKNLPLILSAAVDFSLANLRVGQLVVVVTIFAFTGTMLAMLPLVYALIRPQSSAKLLDEMRTWLIAHNAPIMAAIFALMGVSFLGQAISAFGS